MTIISVSNTPSRPTIWRWGESNPRPNGPSISVYRLRSGGYVLIFRGSWSVLGRSRVAMSLQPTSVSYRQALRVYREWGQGLGVPNLVRSGYYQAARANSASSRTKSSSFLAVKGFASLTSWRLTCSWWSDPRQSKPIHPRRELLV